MDPTSGKLFQIEDEEEARKRIKAALNEVAVPLTSAQAEARGLIPVTRDLTARESLEMEIKKYSPCACGSGKKFKFCCFRAKEGT